MSGRSSRSTLIATTLAFTIAAVASSSNDSCAITWHQWQAAYPTDSSTGTSRRFASANASSDQGHQSTGLSACCSRYGLVALLSRFIHPILHQFRRESVRTVTCYDCHTLTDRICIVPVHAPAAVLSSATLAMKYIACCGTWSVVVYTWTPSRYQVTRSLVHISEYVWKPAERLAGVGTGPPMYFLPTVWS